MRRDTGKYTENSLTGIYVTEWTVRSAYANRRLPKCSDTIPRKYWRIPFLDAIHPDDRNMVKEMAQARLAGQPVRQTIMSCVSCTRMAIPGMVKPSLVLIEYDYQGRCYFG